MKKRIFRLAHDVARAGAAQAIKEAPDGYIVTIEEPRRSLDANAALWPLLTEISRQTEWPVNGTMTRLEPEEWKTILTAGFKGETLRLAQGVNGGVVMLGTRTSRMGKSEFSEFLEFVHWFCAERGVEVRAAA